LAKVLARACTNKLRLRASTVMKWRGPFEVDHE
jgi:hypothetical protein